ncbi:5'-methylthioadenosine/S-adenosylhomocysteine nucleosidase [Phyllobacterium sp. YR531]|uniref:5'-methylthioadenosine/S-adenosylhomocysteine nucleosidase n=1 Tax=Phyllobacterium sp. YR531 TaxID=1144343 RepID=UPI00026F4998|nr:5'-methylthioadenosine/S-adenosylhomocysteine nucleosidase [Phyllobacterium sp. YR531]EJN03088.1 5''-methylthioadenosine/S-adenosylhomocysteine nucleosidase, putative [Phyllobacterium sp. YR531]
MFDYVTPIAGKRVLFAMAATAEYGHHLQRLFTPLITGVGPVESAVSVSSVLAHLGAMSALPDLVVSLGSAGSRILEQTEIYQATSVSYRDMDASPLGFTKGATPFLDLPVKLPLDYRIPGIKEATLSSGANIVSGKAYDLVDADMVEMETFSILRACHRFNLPLIGLRGISDGAEELQHLGDWTEYLHIIDEKLAVAVETMAGAIEDGTISI